MKTQAIKVKLRDGEMGAYVAIPDRTPAGAIIAIMEIWLSRTHRDEAERACTLEIPSLYGNYVPMCLAEFRYSQPILRPRCVPNA
jgi:carboxymethylenebutenolidase